MQSRAATGDTQGFVAFLTYDLALTLWLIALASRHSTAKPKA